MNLIKTLARTAVPAITLTLLCGCSTPNQAGDHELATADVHLQYQPKAAAQETLLLEVSVNHKPLRGQKRRASKNFTLHPPPGINAVVWRIKGVSESNIRFNLAADKRWAPDTPVISGITHGIATQLPYNNEDDYGRGLYIRDVRNAKKPFTVQIYGY